MKRLAALFAILHLLMLPGFAVAQDYAGARVLSKTSWVEEWDPASQTWRRVEDNGNAAIEPAGLPESITTITTHIVNGKVISRTSSTDHNAARYAVPVRTPKHHAAIGQYGPFRVLDARRAALVGSTGRSSPAHFDAMLSDFPDIKVLEMIEAPGTRHDIANLAVGRRIREAGMRTHVPNGGSVRSGAVELFLAGAIRTMDTGAQFAVHSWLDNHGREPSDFAPDAPENRLYLDYYVEMGMSEQRAHDFYAMTNSVPHKSALWLGASQMEKWIAAEWESPENSDPDTRFASRTLGGEPLLLLSGVDDALRIPALAIEPIAYAHARSLDPVNRNAKRARRTSADAMISQIETL